MTNQNVFGSTVPSSVDVDSTPLTLGYIFKVGVAGNIKGLRYYAGATEANGHVRTGKLWTATGTELGSLNFAPYVDPTSDNQWREANFASPIAISANTPYVIGVLFEEGNPNGFWSATFGDLATDKVNGDITIYGYLNDPQAIGNGRYFESATLTFPNSASGGHSSYGVDLTFEPSAGAEVNLSGSVAMTMGVSGAISKAKHLSGSIGYSLSTSGVPTRRVNLSGNVPMTMGASGMLSRAVNLVGQVAMTMGLTGSFPRAVQLVGSVAMTLGLTGALKAARHLAGNVAMTMGLSGILSAYNPDDSPTNTEGITINFEDRGIDA